MKNILLVTGNAETTATLSRVLLTRGYGVIFTSTAGLALSVVRYGVDVDAVIADHVLRDMDAREFLSALERATSGRLPVILMSDHVDIQAYLNVLGHGAFDFLFKPIEQRELFRILEVAVNRRSARDREAGRPVYYREAELRSAAGFQ